jgi:hypothetical protein
MIMKTTFLLILDVVDHASPTVKFFQYSTTLNPPPPSPVLHGVADPE